MTLVITHCAEDSLAAFAATTLLDRTVAERASGDWLRTYWQPPMLESQRRYVDLDGREGYSDLVEVASQRKRAPRIHPRDPRNNKSLSGNAARAYLCVRVIATTDHAEDRVLLLSFDTDGKSEASSVRVGVEAALHSREGELAVLVAEATPEFDAWVLAGVDLDDAGIKKRHRAALEALKTNGHSIDPVSEPHRLTSNVGRDPRDAKKLCERLLDLDGQAGPQHERVQSCLRETALDVLCQRGEGAGLKQFVAEVVETLLPLLEGGG